MCTGVADVPMSKRAASSSPSATPYVVYYHSACKGFFGRGFAPVALLEEAGAKYEVRGAQEKPGGVFAPPVVETPEGASISQVTAIMYTLGHELNLAPESAAADAKALQMCCDGVDFVSEGDRDGRIEGDRKAKWLAHFDALLKDEHPLSYADFAVMQALCMVLVFRSSSLCVEDFPPGLKAWFDKMKQTKGYQAVLATGVDLMMGGRAFP